MITLQLSRQLDSHDLSECVVLHHALETYRHSLYEAEEGGLCSLVYFQKAHQILDDLTYDLLEALMGLNQPDSETGIDPVGNLLKVTHPRQGGSRQ